MRSAGAWLGCAAMAPQSASSRISAGAAAARRQLGQPLQQRLLRHQQRAPASASMNASRSAG